MVVCSKSNDGSDRKQRPPTLQHSAPDCLLDRLLLRGRRHDYSSTSSQKLQWSCAQKAMTDQIGNRGHRPYSIRLQIVCWTDYSCEVAGMITRQPVRKSFNGRVLKKQ